MASCSHQACSDVAIHRCNSCLGVFCVSHSRLLVYRIECDDCLAKEQRQTAEATQLGSTRLVIGKGLFLVGLLVLAVGLAMVAFGRRELAVMGIVATTTGIVLTYCGYVVGYSSVGTT
jgi:hypothetical protein